MDELEDQQQKETGAKPMEGMKGVFEEDVAGVAGEDRMGDAVGEGSSKGGEGVGSTSRKRAIEEAIPKDSPPPTLAPSPKRLRVSGLLSEASNPAGKERNETDASTDPPSPTEWTSRCRCFCCKLTSQEPRDL